MIQATYIVFLGGFGEHCLLNILQNVNIPSFTIEDPVAASGEAAGTSMTPLKQV
jgi:hypothetical protein